MRTITYHSYYSGGALAAGMGQLQVVRKGTLVGTAMSVEGYNASAHVANVMSATHNQNSVSNGNINNPPREETVNTVRVNCPSGGGAWFANTGFVPCRIPLEPGDILCMTGTAAATNATAQRLSCDWYVQEG